MNRLIVIDGHAIMYRAFHALPSFMTSKGELVNAVYGFISIILRVISDLHPTHLAVAFDTPKPTFRNKLYKDYQIQRPKMDETLIPQIDRVHQVVREMGIPIFEQDGYEADDIIGTLAYRASGQKSEIRNPKSEKDSEVIIVTGDRDMLQLVDDTTKIYMPVKGLSVSKLFGEKEVEEKYGIKPSQIIDYKALVGDQSDNYPGVAGIGPKTAVTLLVKFDTLEKLYKNVDKLENENIRKKLVENEKLALVSKKLATILTDVPIKVDWIKCQLPNLDKPNIHHLFEDLEFRSLIPRLSGNKKENSTFNIQHSTENIKQEDKNKQISLF